MSPAQYKAKREQLGLTQAGLAALLGIPREAVVRRETGTQRITEEAAIALRSFPRPKLGAFARHPNVQSEPRGSNRVGSTGGSAAATRESKWRIRISDCYCEYEYELIARVDDVCIHDLYELLRERLKASDVHGRFVDPEEYSSPNTAYEPRG